MPAAIPTLLVHQAYFGAVDGVSHGQLTSSLSDAELRTFLVAFTDRPGAVPPGVVLSPYLAAAVHGEYYLISRSWADTAVARPGMVFTHVLLLPRASAGAVPDLAVLLQLLVTQPPPVAARPATLAPLNLTLTAAELAVAPLTVVPAGWLAVARHLVEQPAGAPVYVVTEAEDFEQLLVALWRGLPAPLRISLSWGIRFAPPAHRESVPGLVQVPPTLATRWRGTAAVPLDPATTQAPATALEQLLFGGEEGVKFEQLIAELGQQVDSFRSLRLYQRAYEQARQLRRATATWDELLALVRGLNTLQPNPNKALALKEQAIEALARSIVVVEDTGQQALALRNLPLDAFRTGAAQLGPVVAQSVYHLVTTNLAMPAARTTLLEQLSETDPTRVQSWWQQPAEVTLTQALRSGTVAGSRFIWQGMTHAATTRAYVQRVVPTEPDWEQLLQQTVPAGLSPEVADQVIAWGIGRNWLELTATVLGVAYAPLEALTRQLRAEQPLGLSESARISRLAALVSDAELLALALREPSGQLRELAGTRCGHEPLLLAALDVRQPAWRAIWAASLRVTKSLIAGLIQPGDTIAAFLAEVASGRATESEPLALLANSTFANVLALSERLHLWGHLPAGLRSRFLHATLDALVTAILAGEWTGPVEPALRTAAQSQEYNSRLLHQYRSDPAAVLAVDAVVGNLSDEYLCGYLTNLPAPDSLTATQLGRLVAARRWQHTANALFARAKTDTGFRPALRECASLFSFWDKLRNPTSFNYQITSQELWQALELLMTQLYDQGPKSSGAWLLAGGDPAEIPYAPSPAREWMAALRLLQRGGGGKHISVQTLLEAARRRHYNNPQVLALLDSIRLFNAR